MKIASALLILFAFLSSSVHGISDTEALKIYREANLSYQKLDYARSIELYSRLVDSNTVSAEIFFNLGNSFFKSGNFAKAILNYERALKFAPDDEDINFNLKIASLKVVDRIENVPEIFYNKWIKQLSILLPANSWATIFVVFIWLVFISAAVYLFGNTVGIKKVFFSITSALIFMTIITGIISARSHALAVDEQAIIMSSSVYVKSSPDEKGNDLFILHEGTKVDVQDELNEWKKIRIANGNVGWIKSFEMEVI